MRINFLNLVIVKGVTINNCKDVSNCTVISVGVSTCVVVNVSIVSIASFLCCNNNKKCSLLKKNVTLTVHKFPLLTMVVAIKKRDVKWLYESHQSAASPIFLLDLFHYAVCKYFLTFLSLLRFLLLIKTPPLSKCPLRSIKHVCCAHQVPASTRVILVLAANF